MAEQRGGLTADGGAKSQKASVRGCTWPFQHQLVFYMHSQKPCGSSSEDC